jgi:hypothetical protein
LQFAPSRPGRWLSPEAYEERRKGLRFLDEDG